MEAPWNDPLLHRTFGALIRAEGGTRVDDAQLEAAKGLEQVGDQRRFLGRELIECLEAGNALPDHQLLIAGLLGRHEQDPAASADTAYPHDLERNVDEPVGDGVERGAPVGEFAGAGRVVTVARGRERRELYD